MKFKDRFEKRELIGYSDREGTDIRDGDIVEFYYCFEKGESSNGEDEDYSRMVDVAVNYKGSPVFFCDLGMGSYAWRYNDVCKVIGNIWENPELSSMFPEELLEELFDTRY